VPKLLVDGDGILFRCGFAVEKTKYLVTEGAVLRGFFDTAAEAKAVEGMVWSRKEVEPEENAIYLVKTVLDKLHNRFPDSSLDIYLSAPVGNFRERIAVTHKYKGNRDMSHRPKHLKVLQTFLKDYYGAKVAVGQEADDELSIGATLDSTAIMVSNDKDLRQVPGKHFDWTSEELFNVNKKEGTLTFYSQVLSGDPTDNIFGLSGVGPVKASKMLAGCSSSRDCWKIVLDAYRDKESEDRAIENARLCWLRRKPDELWEPPT
jgi:DNA polymerase I